MKRLLKLGVCGAALIGCVCWAIVPLHAETLPEALSAAYATSPSLAADRERQKATDEQLPQAVSGFRPNITGYATTGVDRIHRRSSRVHESDHTGRIGVKLVQPLFRGMKTVNGIRKAVQTIEAGQAELSNTEQNVLLDAASAYLKLWRDLQISRLSNANVASLESVLVSSKARYRGGELTTTDVEQARMRLSSAVAEQLGNQSQLAASRANFRKTIGHEAGAIQPPPAVDQLMPGSEQKALEIARAMHPAVISAFHTANAARHGVDEAAGDFLPTLSLEGELYREYARAGFKGDEIDGASVQVRLDVPIFQGGTVTSRLRQARAVRAQRDLELIATRQAVEESVRAAWAGLVAARGQIASRRNQVAAASAAHKGVERQARAGLRSTMDVLDSQRELNDARIGLAAARHNESLAGYSLLAAMGWLTAERLNLLVPRYDSRSNLARLRTGAFDFLILR